VGGVAAGGVGGAGGGATGGTGGVAGGTEGTTGDAVGGADGTGATLGGGGGGGGGGAFTALGGRGMIPVVSPRREREPDVSDGSG
jgi:hypothetical protein